MTTLFLFPFAVQQSTNRCLTPTSSTYYQSDTAGYLQYPKMPQSGGTVFSYKTGTASITDTTTFGFPSSQTPIFNQNTSDLGTCLFNHFTENTGISGAVPGFPGALPDGFTSSNRENPIDLDFTYFPIVTNSGSSVSGDIVISNNSTYCTNVNSFTVNSQSLSQFSILTDSSLTSYPIRISYTGGNSSMNIMLAYSYDSTNFTMIFPDNGDPTIAPSGTTEGSQISGNCFYFDLIVNSTSARTITFIAIPQALDQFLAQLGVQYTTADGYDVNTPSNLCTFYYYNTDSNGRLPLSSGTIGLMCSNPGRSLAVPGGTLSSGTFRTGYGTKNSHFIGVPYMVPGTYFSTGVIMFIEDLQYNSLQFTPDATDCYADCDFNDVSFSLVTANPGSGLNTGSKGCLAGAVPRYQSFVIAYFSMTPNNYQGLPTQFTVTINKIQVIIDTSGLISMTQNGSSISVSDSIAKAIAYSMESHGVIGVFKSSGSYYVFTTFDGTLNSSGLGENTYFITRKPVYRTYVDQTFPESTAFTSSGVNNIGPFTFTGNTCTNLSSPKTVQANYLLYTIYAFDGSQSISNKNMSYYAFDGTNYSFYCDTTLPPSSTTSTSGTTTTMILRTYFPLIQGAGGQIPSSPVYVSNGTYAAYVNGVSTNYTITSGSISPLPSSVYQASLIGAQINTCFSFYVHYSSPGVIDTYYFMRSYSGTSSDSNYDTYTIGMNYLNDGSF